MPLQNCHILLVKWSNQWKQLNSKTLHKLSWLVEVVKMLKVATINQLLRPNKLTELVKVVEIVKLA